MATFKDINQLTQKSSPTGTEKLPVSDTEFITPAQIAALASGKVVIVDFNMQTTDFSDIIDYYEDGYIPVLKNGANFFFPANIDTNAEEGLFFQIGYANYINYYYYDLSGWGSGNFTVNESTITIRMNGSTVDTFSTNNALNKTIDLGTVLRSFTETDPIFTASAASGISATDITNWNAKQKAITVSSSEPTSSQGSNGDIWFVI